VAALRHFDVLIVGGGFGGATVARHLQDLLAAKRQPFGSAPAAERGEIA